MLEPIDHQRNKEGKRELVADELCVKINLDGKRMRRWSEIETNSDLLLNTLKD